MPTSMRRFACLTNDFSKEIWYHVAVLAIHNVVLISSGFARPFG
jgi:hypothetical protein